MNQYFIFPQYLIYSTSFQYLYWLMLITKNHSDLVHILINYSLVVIYIFIKEIQVFRQILLEQDKSLILIIKILYYFKLNFNFFPVCILFYLPFF